MSINVEKIKSVLVQNFKQQAKKDNVRPVDVKLFFMLSSPVSFSVYNNGYSVEIITGILLLIKKQVNDYVSKALTNLAIKNQITLQMVNVKMTMDEQQELHLTLHDGHNPVKEITVDELFKINQ